MVVRIPSRAALLAGLALIAPLAHADDRADLARSTCAVLDQAVSTQPGGPLLLASYQPWQAKPPDIEALRNVAFTYDNALASSKAPPGCVLTAWSRTAQVLRARSARSSA